MSYMLTLDMPPEAASFMTRQSSRSLDELKAVFVALVTAKMEESQLSSADVPQNSRRSGLDLFNALRDVGPILGDDEMNVFERMRDFRREVSLS